MTKVITFIKSKLAKAGLALAAMGALSIVLSLFNYNLRLLMWIDLWGTGMGWFIRLALIVGGFVLFFLFGTADDENA